MNEIIFECICLYVLLICLIFFGCLVSLIRGGKILYFISCFLFELKMVKFLMIVRNYILNILVKKKFNVSIVFFKRIKIKKNEG